MGVDARGRRMPVVGDGLCYETRVVVTGPPALDTPRVVVPAERAGEAELRWVHGVCVGVYQRDGNVQSVCIRTPDGVVHVIGRDDWRFSDL